MGKMTSSDSQKAEPSGSEASLRLELANRLAAALASLASQLAELRALGGNTELVAEIQNQCSALTGLQASVATARSSELSQLKQDVRASVAGSTTLAQQTATAVAAATGANQSGISATSAALRSEVNALTSDLYDRRIFDDYLTFSSEQERDAYRRREAESRRYIEQQQARGTPEGELNAAGATVGQMLDAHAHGAGESPEFSARWDRLIKTTEQHRDALRAEGHSTEEFDRNLTTSVRRYLKEKGLTDAQIDAALAASANPLDAVKPYIKNDKDAQALEHDAVKVDFQSEASQAPITTAVAMPSPSFTKGTASTATTDLSDVMATFRAAGVTAAAQPGTCEEPASQAVGTKQPTCVGRSS